MNQRGFSLVSALLGIGISATAIIALMRMSEMGNKNLRQIESKNEILMIQNEIQALLGNSIACTNTFGGEGSDLSVLTGGNSLVIPTLKSKTNADIFVFPFIRGTLKIEEFSIGSWAAADTSASATVSYKYNLSPSTIMERDMKFKIMFDMDTGNPNLLKSCSASGHETIINQELACDAVLGMDAGGNSYYVNGTCESARAACDKIGRSWNAGLNRCDISAAEQLRIKQIECSNKRGVLAKGQPFTSGPNVIASRQIGALTWAACTAQDIVDGYHCYCKTSFLGRNLGMSIVTGTGETIEPGASGRDARRVSLTQNKFTIISKILTIPNLIPGGRANEGRFMKLRFRSSIENGSPIKQWYATEIGCHLVGETAANYDVPNWIPGSTSSDFTTVYNAAAGKGFGPWTSGGNLRFGSNPTNTFVLDPINMHGNAAPPLIAPQDTSIVTHSIREQQIEITAIKYLFPGDRCALMLYSTNAHDVWVDQTDVSMLQFTDDSFYSIEYTNFSTW